METTTERSVVAVQSFEQQLTDLFLGARNSLPRGANGRAEQAPPKHIATSRKMIRQGLCRPFKHLIDVGDEMIDQGVPDTEVNAALSRLIAHFTARALDRHVAQRERPVPVLLTRVQKEVGDYQLAAIRYASSPDSVDAAEALRKEAADIPPVLDQLTPALHMEVVRASSRPARRLSLEHAK